MRVSGPGLTVLKPRPVTPAPIFLLDWAPFSAQYPGAEPAAGGGEKAASSPSPTCQPHPPSFPSESLQPAATAPDRQRVTPKTRSAHASSTRPPGARGLGLLSASLPAPQDRDPTQEFWKHKAGARELHPDCFQGEGEAILRRVCSLGKLKQLDLRLQTGPGRVLESFLARWGHQPPCCCGSRHAFLIQPEKGSPLIPSGPFSSEGPHGDANSSCEAMMARICMRAPAIGLPPVPGAWTRTRWSFPLLPHN